MSRTAEDQREIPLTSLGSCLVTFPLEDTLEGVLILICMEKYQELFDLNNQQELLGLVTILRIPGEETVRQRFPIHLIDRYSRGP